MVTWSTEPRLKQQDFERQYKDIWDSFEERVSLKTRAEEWPSLPSSYQQISNHLALAKKRRYSADLISRLNALVSEGHKQLYRDLPRAKANFLFYLVAGFPLTVRKNASFVFSALALFYLPGFVFFALCYFNHDLIYSLMDYAQVQQFESMYEPGAKSLGRERESDTDFAMFGFYIYNNIGISFQCFASGILFCVGSIFFLIYNGIFIGAAAGHISQVGFTDTFFPFVVGHGSFELTAIALSGAAGLKLGWALLSPGPYSRLYALKLAASEAIIIVYGTTVMLFIAAFIEAFWSSSSLLPISVKYAVGGLLWLLVIYYLVMAGRSRAVK